MSILIKNATIIDPGSSLNKSKKDILIKNGIIEKIADKISDDKAKIISSDALNVSIGWLDIGTHNSEPGYEHRESLVSLSQTAASGGFTGIALFPNSDPCVDNKAAIQFLLNETSDYSVDYFPIGAISKKCKGEEITEMIDMKTYGACAFSDGSKSVNSSGLMLRALEYAKSTNSIIINQSNDNYLSNGNGVHEGPVSTSLGIKASPAISELIPLQRDIKLNEYADSKLLCHLVSSKESVEFLNNSENSKLFSSVSYLNLCKTEEAIEYFDVNYKVNPPLRSAEDKEALISAINKGQIDIICSNHKPLEEEAKKKEFVYADNGAIGLQTVYAALNTFSRVNASRLVRAMAINPRKILGLEMPVIEEGAKANLSLFDDQKSWTFNDKNNQSKSKNSPFLDIELKGQVIGIINGKSAHFNNY